MTDIVESNLNTVDGFANLHTFFMILLFRPRLIICFTFFPNSATLLLHLVNTNVDILVIMVQLVVRLPGRHAVLGSHPR